MQIKLYDCFKHWQHGGIILAIGDPHFDDEEMRWLRKNYIGNEEQVRRINNVVSKNDTIIFLGDIGNPEYLKNIKGYKILIMGNHDRGPSIYKDYFNEIYEGPLFINDKVLLSHEPIDYPYALNIHGHDHSNSERFNDETHVNLCAEHIDYTPQRIDLIIKSGVLKDIPNIHRATIDKASERKKERE